MSVITEERRMSAPSVREFFRSVGERLSILVKQGMSLGVLLFVAVATLYLLFESTNLSRSIKNEFSGFRKSGTVAVPAVREYETRESLRSLVALHRQERENDQRMFRERNRFVNDLAGHASRFASRLVR